MIFYTQIKTDMGQEVPARTGLGSTTVLAVVTIGFGFVGTTKGKEKAVLHKGVHMSFVIYNDITSCFVLLPLSKSFLIKNYFFTAHRGLIT